MDCTDIPNLPPKMEFPNLELLILRNGNLWVKNYQIPDPFFQGMKRFRVFDMKNTYFERPTKAFHSLTNLETLCMIVVDVTILIQLVS